MRYLEDEVLTTGRAAGRPCARRPLTGTLVPVLCGSALKNKGVQLMLDAIVDYLPSPLDVPPVTGIDPRTGEEVVRTVEPRQPFSALAFKIAADPHVGKLAYVRVYSGTLESGSYALQLDQGRARADRPPAADARQPPRRDSSRSAPATSRRSSVSRTPSPATRSAIRPTRSCSSRSPSRSRSSRSRSSRRRAPTRTRWAPRLARLAEEDPTFRVRTNEETGQTLIDGMGELHLEVIVDRMMREFRVDANVGRPQVAYRETITMPVRAEGRHVRQTGGEGQYGHVVVEFEPQERGEGYEFEDKIVGGSVPREYIPPVDAGYPRGDADRRRGGLPDRRSSR